MKTGTAWCVLSRYVEFECLGMRLYIAAFSSEIENQVVLRVVAFAVLVIG